MITLVTVIPIIIKEGTGQAIKDWLYGYFVKIADFLNIPVDFVINFFFLIFGLLFIDIVYKTVKRIYEFT